VPESATAGRRADVPRVVNTEGPAQAGGMFPGGDGDGKGAGAGQPIDPLQPLLPVSPPPPGAGGGVEQYHAECNSVDVVTCVPACNAEHHGFELLATIDGSDTKFSCNLAHGLFSWMGAASMGGYLGDDFASFFSSVISGAAGFYIVTLTEDAGISADLQIRPGQDVRISGASGLAAAPNWGNGGFTVHERGSLSLAGIAVGGGIAVDGVGSLSISGGNLGGDVNILANGVLHLDQVMYQGQSLTGSSGGGGLLQCFTPYTTLNDLWRSTTATAGEHADCPSGAVGVMGLAGAAVHTSTGVGGGRWYRFAGAGGDALPLSPVGLSHGVNGPGHSKCGTYYSGWLTGWTGHPPYGAAYSNTRPPYSYSVPGRYPEAAEGVVEMTACFDSGNPCDTPVAVGVIRRDGFLLWRLPDAPYCTEAGTQSGAYCTTPSGL
jgi:hypothetical protein